MAFGTFDILHPGHLFFLQEAKKLGDHLTVIVARDETVSALKGRWPRHSEQERKRRLAKLKIADRIRLGNNDDKMQVVSEEKPDIIALGYDQKFFVASLRRLANKRWQIRRLPGFHPELFTTSQLAPPEPRQMLVAVAMVANHRRLLMLQRRDPRPQFNGKWEFPGGGVEIGEGIEECLGRETKEETGLTVKIAERLPKIYSRWEKKYGYQVFVVLFICTVVKGKLATLDAESHRARWCTLRQALRLPLLPLNHPMLKENKKILTNYIDW